MISSNHYNKKNAQTPWNIPNVVGHSLDPYTKKIDHTEGFGAFDSILNSYSMGIRSIDIGGGEHDFNAAYCLYKYGIEQMVYDPFMRQEKHNKKVLKVAKKRPFDSCTSISVLNVIDSKKARIKHIKLCYLAVKEFGQVFFKVWSGNGSGVAEKNENSFQSNCNLQSYFEEISSIFGREQIKLDNENKIIACRKMNP